MSATSTRPLDIVIFGGAGDLAFRKLLPALFMAHVHGNLPADARIIGIGRNDWSRADYLAFVNEKAKPFVGSAAHDSHWESYLARLDFVRVDVTSAADYAALATTIGGSDQRVYYLSTAPSLFAGICAHLNSHGLVQAADRVVLEKPLGHDLASSRTINDAVGQHFAEHQVYRIDHYLGKETVQNLMVLRFGNAIFEPLWRSPNIRRYKLQWPKP